jgi:hypothetical protein
MSERCMKRYLLFAIMLILCVSLAYAANYEVEIAPVKDSIFLDDSAAFLLTFTNDLKSIQNFRVYSTEVEWTIPEAIVKVYPEGQTTETIEVTPTKYVSPGIYGVKIKIRVEETDELIEEILPPITIKTRGDIISAYNPSVRMTYEMEDVIDPKEKVQIKVKLDNQNILNISDLVIKISSSLSVLNTEYPVILEPLETKEVKFDYDLDLLQAPGEYKVNFELLKAGQVIDVADPKIVSIGTLTSNFEEEIKKEGVFFKTTVVAVYTSNSNVRGNQEIKIPITWFRNLFTRTDPESTLIKEDGERYLVVDLELDPGETKTLYVTTNYRSMVYFLIFVIIIVFLVYITRSPVKIRKGISEIKTKEGGISSLKIMLQVTSVVKKPIKNVTIADYIPSIATLEKEFIQGTLRPTKILKHEKKGTVLKWEIGELGPKEDRLISYNISSKLSIIGSFRLPRAKVLIREKNKEKHIYSNSLGVEI